MVYAMIALVLAALAAGWLGWKNRALKSELARLQARCRSMQKDRAIRQNLQHMLNGREAEIRRLRDKVAAYEADVQEMESRASDLNMDLFRESGLRILAEKEDGARRLQLEQLEKQLEDAQRALRESEAQAREREEALKAEIAEKQSEIERIRAAHARRAARRAQLESEMLDQVTLDDILGNRAADEEPGTNPAPEPSKDYHQ